MDLATPELGSERQPTPDVLFGELVAPTYVGELEDKLHQFSRQSLDSDSAEKLRELMKLAVAGLKLLHSVFSELPILWVVDEAGKIWFAMEEVVDKTSGALVFPKPAQLKHFSPHERLGHPALVGAKPARIGGEILLDEDDGDLSWCITNSSGRYGTRLGRTSTHLRNVAARFAQHGITLRERFVPPA